jgi:CheY-like chemotaxis protein
MEHSPAKNRILLIDDDWITNMINEKLLRISVVCEINAFVNPEEALDYIKQCAHAKPQELPDVIFLDINMPQMDGWEFLTEFEKLPEHVQKKSNVWMLTSSISPDDIEKSKIYESVKDFVSKPLTTNKINELFA